MRIHTFRRTLPALLALGMILALAAPAVVVSARQDEPVTLYVSVQHDEPVTLFDLDPQMLINAPTPWRELFLSLTGFHPVTGELIPVLAQSWTASDDGRTWTFTLRDDVPWVRWDPVAREAHVVRMVDAHDVVYSIQRVCDPRVGASYPALIDQVIVGCDALLAHDPVDVTDADRDSVGVRALDDTTVEFRLQFAAGHFLSLASTLPMRPVPRDMIEQYGDNWTQPGTIVSNGPFVLDEWRDGRAWTIVTNPHLPADLRGPGNVERVVMTIPETGLESFALYETNQKDLGSVIPQRQEEIVNDPVWSQEIVPDYYPTSFYYAFANDKPPFDNVHVRRAFAAAVDSAAWCAQFILHTCVPMIHFTPPGVFGAPPIDEVGVGFDPDYAREQIALAGYPGCEGFPAITTVTWLGTGEVFTWLAERMEETLGCDPTLFQAEEMAYPDLLARIDPDQPAELRPHMWVLGWGADYLDAHNFLGDFLHCEGDNDLNRPCNEIDDLIDQAAMATDPLVRVALYRDIEERFFGPDGDVPLIPVHSLVILNLVKPWVTLHAPPDRGTYDWYTIDQEAQLAARGG